MGSQQNVVFDSQQSDTNNVEYVNSGNLGNGVDQCVQPRIPTIESYLYPSQFNLPQFSVNPTFDLNRVHAPCPAFTSDQIYQSGFSLPTQYAGQIPSFDSQVPNSSKKSKTSNDAPNICRQSQTGYRFWSVEEDVALTKSYLYVSVDAIVGKDQTLPKLWDRILQVWRGHMGTYNEKRGCNSLSCRWNTIQTAVCKFHSLYESLERAPRSGSNTMDMKREALNMYKQLGDGTSFKFEHCWEIMKDNPKWCSAQLTKTGSSKKAKSVGANAAPSPSVANAAEISSSHEPDHTNVGSSGEKIINDENGLDRPLGRKGSKEKKKKMKEQQGVVDVLTSFQSSFEKQYMYNERNLEWRQQMLQKELELKEKAQLLKEKAQLLKEEAHSKKQKMEDRKEQERIMNTDLDTLQPALRSAFKRMQSQIMKEWEDSGLLGNASGDDDIQI